MQNVVIMLSLDVRPHMILKYLITNLQPYQPIKISKYPTHGNGLCCDSLLVLSINLKQDMILVCKYSLERETGFKNDHFMSGEGNDMSAERLGVLPSKWKSGKSSGKSNACVKVKH